MFTYGRNFWIVCIGMFLFMTSFNLVLPELNEFMHALGGDHFGLILVMFTLSSAITRPFSGKLADHIGRKPIMLTGIVICVIATILYPLSGSVLVFLLLRFLHGFSAGFMPTGGTALVTDVLPADKRGLGMGIWGTFTSLGIGVGQALGSRIRIWAGLDNLFLVATAVAVISTILLASARETIPEKKPFSFSLLRIGWNEVFERSVMPAAIVTFLSSFCSGVVLTMSPEHATFLDIADKGRFFILYVLATIIVRLGTGKISDRIGRRKILLFGLSLMTVSMIMTGNANTPTLFMVSSIVFGVATGITSPTLFAWTADLSLPHRRGIGAGTMYIALELGIMGGSAATLFYDRTFASITLAFYVAATAALCGAIYVAWHLLRRHSLT